MMEELGIEREREWLIKPNNNGLLVERYLISTRHSYRNGRKILFFYYILTHLLTYCADTYKPPAVY